MRPVRYVGRRDLSCLDQRYHGAGFTLLEIIVVVAIIGILGALVVPRVTSFLDLTHETRVRNDLDNVLSVAKMRHATSGVWPETLEEMVVPFGSKEPGFEELPVDPWGNAYLYEMTTEGPVAICYGRDGAVGGEGMDADTILPHRLRS